MVLNILECDLSKAVIKKYSEKFSSANLDTAIATEAHLLGRFRLLFLVVNVTANVRRHNIVLTRTHVRFVWSFLC